MTDWHPQLAERLEDAVPDHLAYTGERFYPDWDGSAVPPRLTREGTSAGSSPALGFRRPDVARGVAFPGRLLCVVCSDVGCSHCPGVAA